MTKLYKSEVKKWDYKAYKKCKHCGAYVKKEDYKSKAYGRYQLYFDICWDCFQKKENGWPVKYDHEYEDDFFSEAN